MLNKMRHRRSHCTFPMIDVALSTGPNRVGVSGKKCTFPKRRVFFTVPDDSQSPETKISGKEFAYVKNRFTVLTRSLPASKWRVHAPGK